MDPEQQTSDPTLAKSLAASERVLQIITFALMMGVIAYASVAIALNQKGINFDLTGQVPIMAFVGVFTLVGSFFIPMLFSIRSLVNTLLRGIKEGKMPASGNPEIDLAQAVSGALTQKHIIGCALAEGGAMANVFAFMQSGSLVSFGFAALALGAIAVRFPLPGSHVENTLRERDRLKSEITE